MQVARAIVKRLQVELTLAEVLVRVWKAIICVLGTQNTHRICLVRCPIVAGERCDGFGNLQLSGTVLRVVTNTSEEFTVSYKSETGETVEHTIEKHGDAGVFYPVLSKGYVTGCQVFDKANQDVTRDDAKLYETGEGNEAELCLCTSGSTPNIWVVLVLTASHLPQKQRVTSFGVKDGSWVTLPPRPAHDLHFF